MKKNAFGIGFVIMTTLVAGLAAEVIDQRTVSVPAGGIDTVRFEVEAGFLDVTGSASNSVDIEAVFEVRTRRSPQQVLQRLEFNHRVQGRTLIVETRTDLDWGRDENAQINLTVGLPSSVNLEIFDGLGWIRVGGVDGNLEIRDGSGDITLAQIGGDITLEDGSGGIDIRGTTGSLSVRDGSGEIRVENVGRGVEIHDNSGEIELVGVGGDVVLYDSSGGIRVEDVEGNLEVRSDSTGGIHYDNVRGEVHVPERRHRRHSW